MMSNPHEKTASVLIPSTVFYGIAVLMAEFTVLTHLAQIVSIPFQLYFAIALGLCLGTVALWCLFFKQWTAHISKHDPKVLLILLGLGFVGAIISLIVNRPDDDDFYYVPNVIFYLQNPQALMGFKIHYLFSAHAPFASFSWATANAYEYMQALVAFGFRLRFLDVYYFIMPAIAGFLLPFALYLAIVHFADDTFAAVLGTLVTVGIILLLGETHRTFGNFSFVRIFQGKAVLLSLGIPLFIAFSMNYFAKPTYKTGLGLLCLATGLIGLSSSAIFILPALACVLALAYVISTQRYQLTMLAGYFATLVYVVAVALYVFLFWKVGLDNGSPANEGWPTTFGGHANFFVNTNTPLTPLALIGSTLLAALVLSGRRRSFLLIWAFSSILLFLNPISAPFLISHVTSANAYWRMFYIYPFPIMTGIIAAALFARLRHGWPGKRVAVVLATSIMLVGLLFLSPTSVFSHQDLGRPTYKLPLHKLRQATAIVEITPAGVMLAPEPMAGIVALLDARFPQIRVRTDAERTWLPSLAEANLRIAASAYIGGTGDDFSALQTVVNLYGSTIRSIVINNKVVDKNPEIVDLLNAHHFTKQRTIDEYTVFWE